MTSLSLIDRLLTDFFNTSIKQADTIDKNYGTLWRELYRLHTAGGKRLRPQLVLMTYEAFGGSDIESIVPIAAAQELIHFSMLIHDDIIDRDIVRYGVDNITGAYEKIYAPFVTDTSNIRHYANSAALMAGDLMVASAHKLIVESTIGNTEKLKALSVMYDGIFDVAGGELLDTESSFRPIGSIDPLLIATYKTASYSFLRPLVIGAHLADASNEPIELLSKMAISLGIAYQLTDDLLGVFGDQKKTGKSNIGDIREGKQTLLANLTSQQISKQEIPDFNQYFGNSEATEKEIEIVRKMMITSGAKEQVQTHINSYMNAASQALSQLPLTKDGQRQFHQLIKSMSDRVY